LVFVNYFGFPQANRRLAAWCRERGVVVIEDNAHGYLSADGDQPLGLSGDLSVFSLRKTLPIPYGAALVINADSEAGARHTATAAPPSNWPLLGRRFVRLIGEYLNRPLKRSRSARPVRALDEVSASKYGLAMDAVSRRMMRLVSPQRIIGNRRRDYVAVVADVCARVGARPVFPTLADGVCPYAVPFVTREKERDMHELRRSRLRVSDWPDLPEGVPQTVSLRSLRSTLFLVLLAY
jgi:hypothetical protein